MASKLAVVALGGNAFTFEGESGSYPERAAHAATMAELVERLLDDGWNLALVHGNGPQVGNLAIQQEEGVAFVPAQPLFSLVAMTQGGLGSLISCAIHRAISGRRTVTGVITHVVVDPDDPAMTEPTKPIGPFLSEREAARLAGERGWQVHSDAGRGYRRVVPSPRPVRILEMAAIRDLLNAGHLVISAGGGGIPVVVGDDGALTCVEAVIDKDYAATELALAVGAEALVLVTAVDAVQLDFGTPQQRPIAELDLAAAERYLAEGQFPEGSMGPKMRAATRFIRGGGAIAVITSAAHAAQALRATDPNDAAAGTRVVAVPTAQPAQPTPEWSRP
ncbi:MAG TPA: carbamate kinase [Mycobacterium sp.]|nr:carbamate kinase [Mycobacterium sp.]